MSYTRPLMFTCNDEPTRYYQPVPNHRITPTDHMTTSTVKIHLYGHGLEVVGSLSSEPEVIGTFAEDVVTGSDGAKYALFTIADGTPGIPSSWAGTYRIDVNRLAAMGEDVFV